MHSPIVFIHRDLHVIKLPKRIHDCLIISTPTSLKKKRQIKNDNKVEGNLFK